MALPDTVGIKTGSPFVFAHTDHNPGANASNNLGGRTHQLNLASLANGTARQSVKVDLGGGVDHRAGRFACMAALEFNTSPTAGEVVDFYWAPSPAANATQGNPGNIIGSDAAYAGYSSNLADSIKQLDHIGSFIVTTQATTTVQVAFVGMFIATSRYGSLVVYNRTSVVLINDGEEMSVRIAPMIDEVID